MWQTEKTFGYEDIGAEEEFNLLREIFMTSKMASKRILPLIIFRIFLEIFYRRMRTKMKKIRKKKVEKSLKKVCERGMNLI